MARVSALRRRGVRIEPETLLQRAEYLDRPDQALVREVVGRGVHMREVSRLRGCGRRQVERRFRRVIDRLTDRNTPRILRRCRHWDAARRQVALTVFVRGRSLREAASELDLSFHEIRSHVGALRTLLAEIEREEECGVRNAECGMKEELPLDPSIPQSAPPTPHSEVSP